MTDFDLMEDEKADGYCRAEGYGWVFLKKLSDAVRDGNPILAVIPSTAVHQNQNVTPMFVPNSPSLSTLFKDVLRKAKVAPRDISLVEAHGTGTPVGDPAEYESIRRALGGPVSGRQKKLPIGSVKGHIGHTEGASGVLALIKVIIMMRQAFIPPQASHNKMNGHIDVRPDDMMEVVTKLRSWDEEHKIALLNNYGASGSNASLIVAQPPKSLAVSRNMDTEHSVYPFWITGFDARSISAYASKVASYIRSSPREPNTLADLSFAVNRQCNRSLAQGFMFSSRSMAELEEKLERAASVGSDKDVAAHIGFTSVKAERPVILCFGGQVSRFVGLDRKLYDNVAILRHHLDSCDAVVTSLGLESIYPDIFSKEPIRDTVKLQTTLFATQYACAKAWMDCGLEAKISAVVGHSFGEITALCVAGALSLEDTVKLVAARAKLVRDAWGADPGAMVAVESDQSLVQELLQAANSTPNSDGSASIACYNGPRSFTLAGSTAAVDAIEKTLNSIAKFSAIKSKRLSVTNAFHSGLVEKLVDDLGQVGKSLTFQKPYISVERSTKEGSNTLNWEFVPKHMREPVFFDHAVQRLAKKHPQAIFLEAGFNSTITVMAARALAQSKAVTPGHHFQAVSIANGGFNSLTDVTVALWNQGLRVSFWAHHAQQTLEYAPLLLPPYQFDKSPASRHWLPVKSPLELVEKAAEALLLQRGGVSGHGQIEGIEAKPLAMWDFVGYQDENRKKARFRINTGSDKYQRFFTGHLIAQTAPICPGTLECDIAIEALFNLHPDWVEGGMLPVMRDLVNEAPICADPSRVFYIELSSLDKKSKQWGVHIFSVEKDAAVEQPKTHAEAHIDMRSPTEAAYIQEYAHFERLASHVRCQELLKLSLDDDGVESLQGRQVYRAFAPVVDYSELYRGVRYVVGRGAECAGVVQLDRRYRQPDTWLDTPLSDSFSQVGGLWVNIMTDCPPEDMYIANGCQFSMRSPKHKLADRAATDVWHVYARHLRQNDAAYTTDVFVFDPATGLLVEVMLGVLYQRVARVSMGKMLARMTKDESVLRIKAPAPTAGASAADATTKPDPKPSKKVVPKKTKKSKKASPAPVSGRRDITEEVQNLVAEISGIGAEEMSLDAEMADFGIDSLMGMELGREVERIFKCTLDQVEQMEATTLRMFVRCVEHALFGEDADVPLPPADVDDSDEDSFDDDSSEDSLVIVDRNLSSSSSDVSSGFENILTPDSGDQTPQHQKHEYVKAAEPTKAKLSSAISNLSLSPTDVLSSFGEIKMTTDAYLREWNLDNIEKATLVGNGRLTAALVVEAFNELGCYLGDAVDGQLLDRVPFLPEHGRLMESVYQFLERDARLVNIDSVSGQLTRTHVPVPSKPSSVILDELLIQHPAFAVPSRLCFHACKNLASVLSGKTDGIRVLFGSPEGRELVAAMYCEYTVNRMCYTQIREVIRKVCERANVLQKGETLKILEMGAGTGGTTMVLLPFLAELGIPVEYTFTDLSPSMVASTRRRWGKEYPFMRFLTHDIEKPPAEELKGAHIVLASNAVHATHNLVTSLTNMHKALRPDGFVMLVEMTEIVPFVDFVFGLLEGWWLFDDGRKHAVVTEEHWEREFHKAGYGHVDWTDGHLPEAAYQKVIIAMASGHQRERLPMPAPVNVIDKGDVPARTAEAERLVSKYSSGWASPRLQVLNAQREKTKTTANSSRAANLGAVVLVTGATGSLGSHIVQQLAENPAVFQVVCVNRRRSSGISVEKRQQDAFSSRGIILTPGARAKLRILETDTSISKLDLSLPPQEHAWLIQNVTHVVHNAWPMSATRPIGAFEPHFQMMRNLLDLARDIAIARSNVKVGFQFVSSIGVVGFCGEARVLEDRVPLEATLPSGYGEGKWVCERMLDETLHRYPELFRAMVVRPGQISGSSKSGYWNASEHFAFLIKSSQALQAWPDLEGTLQWIPVDHCGAIAADLVLNPKASHAVYHIDNPVGQSWKSMSPVLARALDIPTSNIVPFQSWIKRVRTSPLTEMENPAGRPGMAEFLGGHFERMSCGGLILDVERAKEHSVTMAGEGPVSPEVALKIISAWKESGFLD
ncbi:Iterative polyketide synthase CazM [Lachnellula suecica]|uniref:Iterative polyketide synthase CazM n=1 Tax=Lachnellula suecica TaxID=602035 RepID=A0A8T9C6U0_9HELO|nr:Iterative polyketide synthase CazM [Lachnellula suecica]